MRLPLALVIGLLLTGPLCADPPDPPAPIVPEPADTTAMKPAAQRFKELVPGLIDALRDPDPDVRQHAALALATIGTDALKPLTEALKDANKERRAASAYAIGQMGYPGRDAIPELLKTLKDDDANVRRAGAQAISRIVSSENRSLNSLASRQSRSDLLGPPPLSLPTRGIFPAVPEPTPSPTPDKDKPQK